MLVLILPWAIVFLTMWQLRQEWLKRDGMLKGCEIDEMKTSISVF